MGVSCEFVVGRHTWRWAGLLWRTGTMERVDTGWGSYICTCTHGYRRATITSCNGNTAFKEQTQGKTFNANHHMVVTIWLPWMGSVVHLKHGTIQQSHCDCIVAPFYWCFHTLGLLLSAIMKHIWIFENIHTDIPPHTQKHTSAYLRS